MSTITLFPWDRLSFVTAMRAVGITLLSAGLLPLFGAIDTPKSELAPLDIPLPQAAFQGTPADMVLTPHMEKPSDKPRPAFLAPKGAKNVALKKKVTSSDPSPITGELALVTDGDKEATDESFVELHRKPQWIQIDLAGDYRLYAIVVWHAHNMPQFYRDVIVQVSDDPSFTRHVRSLFNNDFDNSANQGIGTDKEYMENFEGRLIDAQGAPARYVRLYSNGGTYTSLNRYTEVEVYALPAAQ